MIEVLATTIWRIHWAACNGDGIDGQVTKCRFEGVVFYVRENIAVDHFLISSNERWGMKAGKTPKSAVQVLELCAPKRAWDALAKLVHDTDTLKRRVRHNVRFTLEWAARAFET